MNAPAPETFAKRLKHVMKENSLTQREVARRCSVAQTAVSKWLHSTIPTAEKIQRIAIHLNVDEDWLKTGKGKPTLSVEEKREREAARKALKEAAQYKLQLSNNFGRVIVIHEAYASGVREFLFDMATDEQWALIKTQIEAGYHLITQVEPRRPAKPEVLRD